MEKSVMVSGDRFRKSELQTKLEAEGWSFLTNISNAYFGNPNTNEHLEEEYMKKGYKEVLIQNSAFDIRGRKIDNQDCRAVYIKL